MIRDPRIFGWVFLLFWGLPAGALSQNLVPNPGFEDYQSCPRYLGNLHEDAAAWTTPSRGSTDYFHLCSQHMGTPENFNGAQHTLEGKGYAGFYAYAPGDYREYLQVALKSPLRAGRTYRLSLHLSLAERSDYAIRDLGVLFSSAPLSFDTTKPLSRGKWYSVSGNDYNYMDIRADEFLEDTSGWARLETRFEAKGTEAYLILGNFRPNRETRTQATRRKSNKGAYYYLDLVELKEAAGAKAVAGASLGTPEPGRFPLDSLQVFRSLLFEFDTFRISASGREELKSLYQFLQRDTTLRLQLGGHTDATGTPSYNKMLSERRCQAVAAYLEELGIPSGRIRWEGYGASQPVSTNSTEAGRTRNRRVEFLIQKE